jgi:hypothetical protein
MFKSIMPNVAVAQWPRIDAAHCIELGVEGTGKVNLIPGQENPCRRQGAGTNSFEYGLNVRTNCGEQFHAWQNPAWVGDSCEIPTRFE